MEKEQIRSLSGEELQEELEKMGHKAFRSRQIYQWLHEKRVSEFDEMTNISEALREELKKRYVIAPVVIERVQVSKIDQTRKYLFSLGDGNLIESVWMKYKHGNSVCISTQVGCKMGCVFCASAIGGFVRHLTAAEMLSQIYEIEYHTGERVSNVVLMGIGEPLDNYDNVLKLIKMINNPIGLHISQRNITVSTCGVVPRIKDLADECLQITLAISLHASNDKKRAALMPIANRYSIAELLEACKYYFQKTGRRITFEYSLIGGVNDTWEDAGELGELLKELNCHINLIPVNPVRERAFCQSDKKIVEKFKNKLEKYTINVTIRREMGQDIDGACGQLRNKYSNTIHRESEEET